MRAVIAFVGILTVLYATLLYIAYWFDRINNYIEFSALGLLTVGKLVISPDDNVSTYTPSNKSVKAVTHKNICTVCLIGISIGILLLTGKVYTLIGLLFSLIGTITGSVF